MKRFLSIILTAAMLMSATPAVFAENNAVDESVIVAERLTTENQEEVTEKVTEEVTKNVAEDVSEEISGEGEENFEEQISLMSEENEVSLMANETNEVLYSTDNAKWTGSTLADAVAAIGKGTGTIKVLKDITLTSGISIKGKITILADGADRTITRGFADRTAVSSSTPGDAMFSVYNTATGGSQATLTLGSEGGGNMLILDGNKDIWGNACVGPIIYLNGVASYHVDLKAYGNVTLQNNKSSEEGGAIYQYGYGNITLDGTHIKNNEAKNGGAVEIYNNNAYNTAHNCSAVIKNAVFSHNTAAEEGGAFWSGYSGTVVAFNGCLFDNNVSGGKGSAVYLGGTAYFKDRTTKTPLSEAIVFDGCSFTGNTYSGTKEPYTATQAYDLSSTIYLYGGSTVTDDSIVMKGTSTFANNTTSDICLYLDSFKGDGKVVYLDDSFSVANGGTVKVMHGAFATASDSNYNVSLTEAKKYLQKDIFKCSNAKAGEFAEKFVPVRDKWNKCNSVNSVAFAANTDKNGLWLEEATYSVTITDPIYMAATYPGGTDSKIGTITVTGASDLAAVPEGTELTLAITVADDTKAKNHSFVKWVVKTVSGTDVTVTDNKFTMPGEAVTVTAEYVPDIQMTFYAGGTSADSSNECKDYAWSENGSITYTMPDNKGTLTISTPNGFKLWQYIVDDETKTPTVTANDVVTVTVNTNEGYTFNGIKSVTSQMGNLKGTFNNSGPYTFSVPVGTFNNYKGTQNAYIILDIATNQYNIIKNYNTNEGEVIVIDKFDSTHTSIDKAYYKENLWVSIEPKANYKIKSVSCKAGENNVSNFAQAGTTGKSYTFTMPASDVTINVEFELDVAQVTLTQPEGGSITVNGSSDASINATIGSTVTLAQTPNTEYDFQSWKVYKTGEEATSVEVKDNSFTMPAYGVTVTATYVKKTHDVTLTVKDGVGGTLTMDKFSPVTVGETVTLTAAPADGYQLKSLTSKDVTISEDNTFTMPNKAVTVTAEFEKIKYSITASECENGTISVTETPLEWGTTAYFSVTPNTHYELDTLTVDGGSITPTLESGIYSFTVPMHDVTVSATFKKVKYTITGTGDHATFSIPSSDTYNWGDTVEFTVTPDKWYSIKSVYADNETVAITKVDGNENTYSFTMPQGNVIITAVTERPNFTVTFDSKGGSNITPKTVANGDAADKPGVPVWAGRGFAGWYTDESCTQKYNFTAPVTKNITLYARWFLWGDVNNDGTVDSYDALLIRRCRAGLTDYSLIENRLAGFVNGFETGRDYPDSGDAVSIRRFRAGLINRYKVEDGAAGYEFDLENDTYIPKN